MARIKEKTAVISRRERQSYKQRFLDIATLIDDFDLLVGDEDAYVFRNPNQTSTVIRKIGVLQEKQAS